MRTEDDLRDAFTMIADRAPAPGTEHVAPQRPRRGRVTVVALAVAATAVVVAIPVGLLAADRDPTPAAARDVLRRTFDVQVTGGWRESARYMFGGHEMAGLENAAGNTFCTVVVFRPGVFDAGRIPKDADRLTVRGKPGHYALITGALAPSPLDGLGAAPSPTTGPDAPRQWSVLWQYADDAWAASSCPPAPGAEGEQNPPTLRRYAERFANGTTVTPGSVRLPLKLGYLPAGLGLVLAGIEPHGRGADRLDEVELELLDPSEPEPVNSRLTIRLEPPTRLPDYPGTERLTINGRRAVLEDAGLTIAGDGFNVGLRSLQPTAENRAELRRIAEQLELAADPKDRSTWFDAADALP